MNLKWILFDALVIIYIHIVIANLGGPIVLIAGIWSPLLSTLVFSKGIHTMNTERVYRFVNFEQYTIKKERGNSL